MKISVNVQIEMTEKETEIYIKEDNIKQIRDQIRNEVNRQARYNAKRNNK